MAFKIRAQGKKRIHEEKNIAINACWVHNTVNKERNFLLHIFCWKSEGGSTASWIDSDWLHRNTQKEKAIFVRYKQHSKSSAESEMIIGEMHPWKQHFRGIGILTEFWIAFTSKDEMNPETYQN